LALFAQKKNGEAGAKNDFHLPPKCRCLHKQEDEKKYYSDLFCNFLSSALRTIDIFPSQIMMKMFR
jgi:hypothetical protein